jgi:hypothetical protein
LASGDCLWWLDARRGKVLKRWPDTTPLGFGRGALVGDQVAWPTRDALYVFDQEVSPRTKTRDPILLGARHASGGNIVPADGLVLVATSERLFGFQQSGNEPTADKPAPTSGKTAQVPPAADPDRPRATTINSDVPEPAKP